MHISKVRIENFKKFKGEFELLLNKDINILVGNNEEGKSTILEAIHLALTGLFNGRYIKNELTQYLFNNEIEEEYLSSINEHGNTPLSPPYVLIEIFFESDQHPILEGDDNSARDRACGIYLKIEFDEQYSSEYAELIKTELYSIPIEFYKLTWKSFARESITSRSIPIKSVLIDTSGVRFNNGSDIYISRIIRDELEEKDKVSVSQAYRKMKESFAKDESIENINTIINEIVQLSDTKSVSISVDLASKDAWITGLMTFLDKVPFHHIGKGEQAIIKTKLALGNKNAQKAGIILIEEPENHLTHAKLNQFIKNIQDNCIGKQVIISTHSSFVANKLGLEHLLLLNNQILVKLGDLSLSTQSFFKKLPGYQTLRMILCDKAILVEGNSDELIVQKAFMDSNGGLLPIEKNIDVISVGLSFERFLQIATIINKPIAIVTDNDGDYLNKIEKKYEEYKESKNIKIFADNRDDLNTLEPQFVDANKDRLEELCEIVDIDFIKYSDFDKISAYLIKNKTKYALSVFESNKKLDYPNYINELIIWSNEE